MPITSTATSPMRAATVDTGPARRGVPTRFLSMLLPLRVWNPHLRAGIDATAASSTSGASVETVLNSWCVTLRPICALPVCSNACLRVVPSAPSRRTPVRESDVFPLRFRLRLLRPGPWARLEGFVYRPVIYLLKIPGPGPLLVSLLVFPVLFAPLMAASMEQSDQAVDEANGRR